MIPPKEIPVDGCGVKASKWFLARNVPQFVFRQDCNQHDRAYTLGGTESDRKAADDAFYAAMLASAGLASWWLRDYYRTQATWYYWAVRVGGGNYFKYKVSL